MTKEHFNQLRRAYRGLPDSFHKQRGTRCLRDIVALGKRGHYPNETTALLALAAFHLPYAQSYAERVAEDPREH
jgi:hypothetical protein